MKNMNLRNTRKTVTKFLLRNKYPTFHAIYRGIEADVLNNVFSQLFSTSSSPQNEGKKPTILDAGCGDGSFFESLPINRESYKIGADIAFGNHRLPKQVYDDIVRCDFQKLPFAENKFDIVFSNSVIEHLDEPAIAIENINLILKPFGKCVLTTVTTKFESPEWILSINGAHAVEKLINRMQHKNHFTKKTIEELMLKNNLRPVFQISTHGPIIMVAYHFLRFTEEEIKLKSAKLNAVKHYLASPLVFFIIQFPLIYVSNLGADLCSVSIKEK